MTAPEHRPPAIRLRQGLALLAGAVALMLLVEPEGSRFYLTPLGLGLAYLAAAALGGPRGGYWPTALVLTGWGLAVVLVREARPELDTAGLYLLGAGLGAVAAAVLARRGFSADPLGAAATVAAAGLVLALSPQADALVQTRTFAVALGLVGLVNVIWALMPRAGERGTG